MRISLLEAGIDFVQQSIEAAAQDDSATFTSSFVCESLILHYTTGLKSCSRTKEPFNTE